MPPKRSKSSSSSASAPKRKKKVAADWRQPAFYWRGTVTGSTWEGAWVASAEGLPSNADFETSANTFKLECSTALDRLYDACRGDGGGGALTGSYKLDNGDGLEDYSDLAHDVFAINGPFSHHPATHSWAVVGACGDTEFGRFVSLGVLDGKAPGQVPGDDTYTRLTLVRRYLADDDPRIGMSAKQVADRLRGEEEWAFNAPWLVLPWKVPGNWPAPMDPTPFVEILEAHCEDEGTDWCIGTGPLLQP